MATIENNKFNNIPFYVKLASILVSLIAVGYIAVVGKNLLSPLIFSCLFSILLLPIAQFLERKLKFHRTISSMIAVIFFLILIGFVIYIIGFQINTLANDWPQFQKQLNTSILNIQRWISHTFHFNISKQINYVNSETSKIMDSGTSVIGVTLLSVSSYLLFFVFTFIYTFFLLLYRRLIMSFLVSVFLDENSSVVHEVLEQIQFMIRKYIIGLLIEMAIVTTVVCLAFWFFGVEYAILLGLLTGLLNIIPYIGILIALIVSCVITFATATAITSVIFVAVTLIIVHLIDSNILLPLIVGSKVRINALITVLGVIIGEMIWGISGMFLSIPIIAVLKIIFDRVENLKPWGIILGDEEHKQNALAENKKLTLD
jgi:putative permease